MFDFKDAIRSERVRDFKPPWRTELIYKCRKCGKETRLRKNWHGETPRGGFLCACEIEVRSLVE